MRLFLAAIAAVGCSVLRRSHRLMVTITDTLNIIKRLLLAPSCLATRKRLFLLRRWTRTMAVAITCIGPLGMGFKILPRAIGKRAGLQLPFSVILALRSRAGSRTIRARRNNPGGLFRLLRSRARSSTWLRRRDRRSRFPMGGWRYGNR
jgi:hypothetical protein